MPFANLKSLGLTGLLLSINIAFFVIETLNGVNFYSPTTIDLLHWGANFAPLTLTGDAWRLLSSMFLHIGIIHLAVNCWALYAFGIYAEFYYGRLYYFSLYFTAGLFGGLANLLHNRATLDMLMKGDLPPISAGASGAIMGLGGALIVAAWRPKQGLHITQTLKLKPLLIIMAINFAFGLSVQGVDNAAHLSGLLGGVLVALVFSFTNQMPIALRNTLRIGIFFLFFIASWAVFHQLESHAIDLMPVRVEMLSQLENHS